MPYPHSTLSVQQSILIVVWFPGHKFKIWGKSDQRLLRYSIFCNLRSSSIGGLFHLKLFLFQFVPLSLSFKFEENPMSGCWDIQLFIICGRLLLEVIFISSIFVFWFDPLSLSLKFEEDRIIGCWDIQFLILWGHLPLEVLFQWRFSSFKPSLTLVWSPELKFIWDRSEQGCWDI